jgi:hypothetical protein
MSTKSPLDDNLGALYGPSAFTAVRIEQEKIKCASYGCRLL